jgi:hypothetical protein
MFANKEGIARRIERRDRQRNRNTLTKPRTWWDRQVWVVARAPRVSHH